MAEIIPAGLTQRAGVKTFFLIKQMADGRMRSFFRKICASEKGRLLLWSAVPRSLALPLSESWSQIGADRLHVMTEHERKLSAS